MEEAVIDFWGHPAVAALHTRTFEVTKDDILGPQGDCIIGVSASMACADLRPALGEALRHADACVTLRIEVGTASVECQAWGDPALTLRSLHDIVVRRSAFVCTRTLAIRATLSAADFPRDMVDQLRNPRQRGRLIVRVDGP